MPLDDLETLGKYEETVRKADVKNLLATEYVPKKNVKDAITQLLIFCDEALKHAESAEAEGMIDIIKIEIVQQYKKLESLKEV